MFLLLVTAHSFANHDEQDRMANASVSQLLDPLQNFQVILYQPIFNNAVRNGKPQQPVYRQHGAIIQEAIDFLQLRNQPVQISRVINSVSNAPHFAAGRHIENLVVWFVFVEAESKIFLNDILISLTYPTGTFQEPVPTKHLINLVVIHTESSSADNFQLFFQVLPLLTPLFLMICDVYPDGNIPTASISIFDMCPQPEMCHVVPVPNYVHLLRVKGMKEVVSWISNKHRKNFRGVRLIIQPNIVLNHGWEDWKMVTATPWNTHRLSFELIRALLGELCMLFVAMHNITFDTNTKPHTVQRGNGLIAMRIVVDCVGSTCLRGPCSLNMFDWMRTITGAAVGDQGDSYKVKSLVKPLKRTIRWTLIAMAIGVGLMMTRKSKNLDLSAALLLSFSAIVSQADASRARRRIYIPWLLLTAFISIIYTSLLQSRIVRPRSVIQELPFEEILQNNYSLFSSQAAFLRTMAADMKRKTGLLDAKSQAKLRKMNWKIRKIGEIVIADDTNHLTAIPFLKVLTREDRRVLIENRFYTRFYSKMLRVLNRHAVKGKERFLAFPVFWYFAAPKSFMLVRSLERMKAMGLVSYLMKQMEKVQVKVAVKDAKLQKKRSRPRRGEGRGGKTIWSGFSNSVLRESFVVLAYGFGCSVLAFAFEILQRYVIARL